MNKKILKLFKMTKLINLKTSLLTNPKIVNKEPLSSVMVVFKINTKKKEINLKISLNLPHKMDKPKKDRPKMDRPKKEPNLPHHQKDY